MSDEREPLILHLTEYQRMALHTLLTSDAHRSERDGTAESTFARAIAAVRDQVEVDMAVRAVDRRAPAGQPRETWVAPPDLNPVRKCCNSTVNQQHARGCTPQAPDMAYRPCCDTTINVRHADTCPIRR